MSRQTFFLTILGCFFAKLKPKPKWKLPAIEQGFLTGLKSYKFHYDLTRLDDPSGIGGVYRFKTNQWQS